jgi:hypothetical protein
MNNSSFVSLFGSQLLAAGPTLLICLVACLLIGLEWRRGGRASLWAMLGFGLAALLMVAGPLVWTFVTMAMTQSGGDNSVSMRTVMPIISVSLGLLHALAYGFLLLAVLAGRSPRTPGT